MLNYLALQNCHKLRKKKKIRTSFHVCCYGNILFCIKKKYGFAGLNASLVSVVAPPPLGMETGGSLHLPLGHNSLYNACMSRRML